MVLSLLGFTVYQRCIKSTQIFLVSGLLYHLWALLIMHWPLNLGNILKDLLQSEYSCSDTFNQELKETDISDKFTISYDKLVH